MRESALLLCLAAVLSACHPNRPVIDAGARQPSVGGTIAGVVSTADHSVAVRGRVVSATETKTGVRHDATTAENGGYSIKVPEGTYRLDVELHEGETVTKRPDDTHIGNSDIDSGRNFVITATSLPRKDRQ